MPIDGSRGSEYLHNHMRLAKHFAVLSVAFAVLLVGCSPMLTGATASATATPEAALQEPDGERLFSQNCAACHGEQARGTKQGPPLVHKIYEPSHHSDAAFVSAARNGSKQHHWPFGDMPAQPQVTEVQVKAITAYVRVLQREAGIR